MSAMITALSNISKTGYVVELWNIGKIVIGDYATGAYEKFAAPTMAELDELTIFMERVDIIEKTFSEGMGYSTAEGYAARRARMYPGIV